MIAVPYTNLADHFVYYMTSKNIHGYRNRIDIIAELLHIQSARWRDQTRDDVCENVFLLATKRIPPNVGRKRFLCL
jgi:hypothetical protein